VIDKDPEWGEIGGIAAYGGNVYLLDKSMGAIWRYPAVEGGGFGSKQEWLAQPLDLTGAEGMVIDGAIWVVEPQDVRRMMMGVEEGFKVKNLQEAPGKLTGMYTSGDLANLYLLDQGGKRVIVADKESGEYKEQYQWDKIGEAKKIAVDEKESKILLLMGKEIYEIGIK
jgi:hypothetical protein